MTQIMNDAHPEWDKEDIKEIVEKMVVENFSNPQVHLDNNYTHEERDTTLLSVVDWALSQKPIIAGNGTFYKNHNIVKNPVAKMLDDMAAKRSAFKKQMFKAGDIYGADSDQYADFDRKQGNEKINMNSYYGGSGAPTSSFYSKWSGPATTLTAQSVISTAMNLFESFLVDNYKFINLNELMDWIRIVLKEEDTYIDKFIIPAGVNELLDRLSHKIIVENDNDIDFLMDYLSKLEPEQITRLYYKNNFIEFIRNHETIQEIFVLILESINNYEYATDDDKWIKQLPKEFREEYAQKTKKKWNDFVNHEFFINPNQPPESVVPLLNELLNYVRKYVYVEEFLSFDRIYRLKNFHRRVVTVIDTDSNFLSFDIIMKFLSENIIDLDGYGRSRENNVYIVVNTLTYIVSDIIDKSLHHYGKCSNVPESERYRFSMKNEFFNELLIIGDTKKRYISKQRLREGNLLKPAKSDVKGFDLKKASTSEYAEKKFMEVINKHILGPQIDTRGMIQDVKKFKNEVRESILKGERKFLPNGNAKELIAYKEPGTEQSVRGVLTWNMIHTDNIIEVPSKVSLVKMNIFSIDDMAPLKETYPEIYNTIKKKIFEDETGIFVVKTWEPPITYVNKNKRDWYNDIPKKYRSKYKKLGGEMWNLFVDEVNEGKHEKKIKPEELTGYYTYRYRGLQVLAIPSNAAIPEWALPFVDVDTMVNNIIAPINPVLEIFGFKFPEVGRARNGVNRKTNTVSEIIKF